MLLNFLLFGLHAVLGTVTLIVGDREASAPVYRSVVEAPQSQSDKLDVAGVARVGMLNLTALVASFFYITAFFHLGNAVLWKQWYLNGVRHCFTPSRWVEYTFSAAILIVLVAYASGILLLDTLVALFTLTAVTMFFGYLTEVVSRPRTLRAWSAPLAERLQPHLLGYVPQVVVWFIVISSFYTTTSDVNAGPTQVPDFVYAIVWVEFLLFFSFAAVQLVVTAFQPRVYPAGEIAYQLLSLLSKAFLGIIFLVYILR